MSHRPKISQAELDRQIEGIKSLSQAFDQVADHVIITNPDGYVVYANPVALTKTGFSQAEVIGKNPGDLWGGQMPKSVYESMWRTIKTEKRPWIGEVDNRKKDGTRYRQQLWVNPVLADSGEVLYFVGIEPEILDERLARSKQFNVAEVESLKEFLAGREQKIGELEQTIAKLKSELKDQAPG